MQKMQPYSAEKYLNDITIHEQKILRKNFKEIELSNTQIRSVLSKVVLSKYSVEILLCEDGITQFLESMISPKEYLKEATTNSSETILIKKDIKIARTSKKGSVLIVNGKPKTSNIDPILIAAIVKSYRWNKMLKIGEIKQIKDIAKLESRHCTDYIKRIVRLNILSPRIIESILDGTQPPDMSLQKLYSIKTLDWKEQEKLLNYV